VIRIKGGNEDAEASADRAERDSSIEARFLVTLLRPRVVREWRLKKVEK